MTYEKYNLKTNPFTDQSLNYPIVDRAETRKRVTRHLASYIGSKNPAILPLTGEYGVGKTFFLRYMEERILEGRLFGGDKERILAAYITAALPKLPSEYMHYLYSECVKRIGHERFTNLVGELVRKRKAVGSLKGFDVDYLNALINYKRNENVAWEYFRGDTIDRSDAKGLRVRRSIRGDEQSLVALMNLLRLLFVLGYHSMVFLVDEFEYLFARGSQKGAQFLNTFRFLYDRALDRLSEEGGIVNPIFVIACSVVTWDEIVKDAERLALGTKPFVDRSIEPITIPPFDPQETRALIQGRLERWRMNPRDKDRTGLFPFVDDEENNPFEQIMKISRGGLPRMILTNSGLILDEALDKGYNVIGRKEVQAFAQSHGFEKEESQGS